MATTIPVPLAGKKAIVTRGSRSIGAGIATDFARKGCIAIEITYANNKDAAETVLKSIPDIKASIRMVAIQADLLSPTFSHEVVNLALVELSVTDIDTAAANAALADARNLESVLHHTKERFEKLMIANVWSQLRLAMVAIPFMQPGGRMVNISSAASKQANVDQLVVYGASKAALDSITRSLALIFAPSAEITINGIHVGPTVTDTMRAAFETLPP